MSGGHEPFEGLTVRGLGVSARGRAILRDVSLRARDGEVLAVLGPNGSGKTTLLEAIAGLRAHARGEVRIDGHVLASFRDRCPRLSYMPDDEQLPQETTLGVALGLRASDPLVETFGLARLLGARATEVSRGEAKRARLCATLASARPVVLLDEPFGAFDPLQLRALVPAFRRTARPATVVVTVHQMHTAELVADRMLLLAEGRAIASGTLAELRAQADTADTAPLHDVFLRLLDREESHALA